MKIEIVGTSIVTPASMPQVSNGAFGNPSAVPRRYAYDFIHRWYGLGMQFRWVGWG